MIENWTTPNLIGPQNSQFPVSRCRFSDTRTAAMFITVSNFIVKRGEGTKLRTHLLATEMRAPDSN